MQVGIGIRLENLLLYFGGPPKTNGSDRVKQQQQPRSLLILIEVASQGLAVKAESGKGCREFALGRAGSQASRQKQEKKRQ
jgi:hypothetical protein